MQKLISQDHRKIIPILLVLSIIFTTDIFAKCDWAFWPTVAEQTRYPYANKVADQANSLKFGFESEYTLDRIQGIVSHYRPEDYLIPKDQWLKLSPEARADWVVKNKKKLFPDTRVEGGLILDTDDEFLKSFMPSKLIMDDTGNLEIILPPQETLETWYRRVTYANHIFGLGSMQATVGLKSDSFFMKASHVKPELAIKRNIGFLNVVNNYDVLDKLMTGHRRYLESPDKFVMRSFDHPFLGPITKTKHDLFTDILTNNSLGRKLEEKYMTKVSKFESSFKYIGSTSYRPDIAYNKGIIILEARDAHSNFNILADRLKRNTLALMNDRKVFEEAVSLRVFDSVTDYEKLTLSNRKMLEELFPAKLNPLAEKEYYEYLPNRLAVEVYRNFSFPLQDWSSHLIFLKRLDLATKVEKSQIKYVNTLTMIRKQRARSQIDDESAKKMIQGAVAAFADDSGLHRAYKEWLDKVLGQQMNDISKKFEIFHPEAL